MAWLLLVSVLPDLSKPIELILSDNSKKFFVSSSSASKIGVWTGDFRLTAGASLSPNSHLLYKVLFFSRGVLDVVAELTLT